MKYSKGDTIELKDGLIVLVLNDGIKAIQFAERYLGQTVLMLCSEIIMGIKVEKFHGHYGESAFWYNIMIGDDNLWASNLFLYFRVNGVWECDILGHTIIDNDE